MTAASRRVALVAPADQSRAALSEYLREAGFDVHECDELTLSTGFGAIVVVGTDDASADALGVGIKSWIRSTKKQRIVVVTSKPMALRELVAIHGERLFVLPAPAFGWEVVDSLRAPVPTRPRGA